MNLLIYSPIATTRLTYIVHFIFEELMGLACTLTTDIEIFKNERGVKINYSNIDIASNTLQVTPVALLFQTKICTQNIDCFIINNNKAFFKTPQSGYPFDIFAAAFYLLSRYEEYLPHKKDNYGRYAPENALAFKEGFLSLPLINIWVQNFSLAIQQQFPLFISAGRYFKFTPTYDIDIAYRYLHKGAIRNIGAFLHSPSSESIKVWCGISKDPFDCFDWLESIHEKFKVHPIYFFLVAEKMGRYDKNIMPATRAMKQLVNKHAKKYPIGIHPSWQSGDEPLLLKKEKLQLEQLAKKSITNSRQHYLRFNLPEGFHRLLASGITDDYSMGYGSSNGFRASVANSFLWYNLQQEQVTGLRVHPFCFMDSTALLKKNNTVIQALDELLQYHSICKAVNGEMISICHNHILSKDWAAAYEQFLKLAG